MSCAVVCRTARPTICPTDPTDPTDPGDCAAAAWAASTAYSGGALVSYGGSTYQAKWWTQNNTPGAEQWGPWELKGTC